MRVSTDIRSSVVVALTFALVGLGSLGCGGKCELDGNGTYATAQMATTQLLVNDRIAAKGSSQCDVVDWRYITPTEASQATITVRVGDPFRGHKVQGTIKAYDMDARVMASDVIRPGKPKNILSFEAKKGLKYYLEIRAEKGASGYSVQTEFAALDPCARCGAGERCVNQTCVATPPCGGPCSRKMACDEQTDQCVKVPCGGPCRDGYFCDGRRNKCRKGARKCKKTPDCRSGEVCKGKICRRAPCKADGECKRGKVCRSGKCIVKGCESDAECGDRICGTRGKCVDKPADPPVSGNIVSAQDSQGGVMLQIRVGAGHGLKKGMTGSVNGVSKSAFRITNTANTRVKAVMKNIKSAKKLGNKKSVTIRKK
jgi:hypothetical protein